MIDSACLLQSDLYPEVIGAMSEVRQWNGRDRGISHTIPLIVQERIATLCGWKMPIIEQTQEIRYAEYETRRIEQNIIAQVSKEIEPNDYAAFFSIKNKHGNIFETRMFHDIQILYLLRYGKTETARMRQIMDEAKFTENAAIMIEIGRNKQNGPLFIQRIWLRVISTESVTNEASTENSNQKSTQR